MLIPHVNALINHCVFRAAKRLRYATDPEENTSVSRPEVGCDDVSCHLTESIESRMLCVAPEGLNEVTTDLFLQ